MSDGSMTISVVTPSYNQGRYIERTIVSVLKQEGDFSLEYVLVDGCSTDQSVAIISYYDAMLRKGQWPIRCKGISYSWISEHDTGQADAINKGIRCGSGEIIGWLNSDDILYPGSVQAVCDTFRADPRTDVVYGDGLYIDEYDRVLLPYSAGDWNYHRLKETCYLFQPSVFFRRSLIDQCGYLDTSLRFCLDYELWLRFGQVGSFRYIDKVLSGSRWHRDAKTAGRMLPILTETMNMLQRIAGGVHTVWLTHFAETLLAKESEPLIHPEMYVERRRQLLQETFLKWWGWIPPEQLEFMDRNMARRPLRAVPVSGELFEPGRLRVGFDLQLDGSSTIPSLFAPTLLRKLAELFTDDEFIAYPFVGHPENRPHACQEYGFNDLSNVHAALNTMDQSTLNCFWSSLPRNALALLGLPMVVHVNGRVCPRLRGTRVVYTLHDIPVSIHTGGHFHQQLLGSVAKNADAIVALSPALRHAFLEAFPDFPRNRIHVIGPASVIECQVPAKPVTDLTSEGFWLSLYTNDEPVNGIRTLLEVFRGRWGRNDMVRPLVIICLGGHTVDAVQSLADDLTRSGRLALIDGPDAAQLRWLYQSCWGFVFVGRDESSPLPLAEALIQGAAVIAANTDGVREVAGQAPLYFDVNQEHHLTQLLEKLESDGELRIALKDKAVVEAARFSWNKTAKSLHTIYEETVTLPKRTRILFCLGEFLLFDGSQVWKELSRIAAELRGMYEEMEVHVVDSFISPHELEQRIRAVEPDFLFHHVSLGSVAANVTRFTFFGETSAAVSESSQTLRAVPNFDTAPRLVEAAFDHIFTSSPHIRAVVLCSIGCDPQRVSVMSLVTSYCEDGPINAVGQTRATPVLEGARAVTQLAETIRRYNEEHTRVVIPTAYGSQDATSTPQFADEGTRETLGLLARLYRVASRRPLLKSLLRRFPFSGKLLAYLRRTGSVPGGR